MGFFVSYLLFNSITGKKTDETLLEEKGTSTGGKIAAMKYLNQYETSGFSDVFQEGGTFSIIGTISDDRHAEYDQMQVVSSDEPPPTK